MRSYSSFQRYRKWQKVIQPLVRYDRESSDFGYPLFFFYQLEQSIAAGHSLFLNIPITLTGSKDNCLKTVFTDNEEVGKVTFRPAFLKSAFDSQIQKEMNDRLNKFCEKDAQFQSFYSALKTTHSNDQMMPLVVLKEKEGRGACRIITLSKDQNKKTTTLEAHQIAQSYILTTGKRSSIIRFFYFPNKHNSEAFKIDNLEGFMKRKFCKSQFKVRQQSQNSFTFVKIMYTNKSFYNQTLSLVEYMEKYQKIKISKIVTDWILDPLNRYYLIDVKEIEFTNSQEIVRPLRSLTQALSFLTCDVCQQKFRQEELKKVLTSRLINQFFQHLKKRQLDLSFKIPVKHPTDSSRVCDLCYMLVVSESELMELEKKIATITHSLTDTQPESRALLTGQKGQLFQWRLFFYLQDIRDLTLDNIDPKSNYYIMIRIHNSITSFKLEKPADKYHLIKGIKIHYLFSQDQKIEKFLINSEIVIRITKGPNWNSVIAEGNTSGLYEASQKHNMRKFKQILIFNQKAQYSVVGIHIGVKMEGKYDPSHLRLRKTHDAYMVEDGYSNCYALPAEWMETIDPSYCISKSQTQAFSYGLHLGSSERKAILPSLVPKNKKRLVL